MVIGADSAATLGALGQHTVRQHCTKVEVVDGKVLVAVSGPVGLGQRLTGEVEQAWTKGEFASAESWQVMDRLRQKFFPHLEVEFKAAEMAQHVVGGAVAQESVLSHTLVAMRVKNEPRLYQFNHQGAPEEAKESLPFVCIGSGQLVADPFMAFIKGLFWEEGKFPSLPQGEFATVWTIEQAISVATGGLAEPVHIYRLAKEDSSWKARELEDAEFGEHREAIGKAREALQKFRGEFEPLEQEASPPPKPV